MKMTTDNTPNQSGFMGAEEYGGSFQQGTTFRDIVMRQVARISELGSKEWHGGFWETRTKQSGMSSVNEYRYVPNSREEYSNAIAVLEHLLLPHLDTQAEKEAASIKQSMKKAIGAVQDSESAGVVRSKIKLRYRQMLLRELSKFLKRVDYFSEMGGEA
jgi:hypothetical protein